jgi:hypothetical protein
VKAENIQLEEKVQVRFWGIVSACHPLNKLLLLSITLVVSPLVLDVLKGLRRVPVSLFSMNKIYVYYLLIANLFI